MISVIMLCALLGFGYILRIYIRPLGRIHVPSSVVAGLAGLLLVQGLAAIHARGHPMDRVITLYPELIRQWKPLPEALVNIVFACFFLGAKPPKLSTLGYSIGMQTLYGQILVWGQYVVAVGLWVLAIRWLFPQFPDMFAGVLPIGFAGGHGTAAGMGAVFEHYDWPAGREFGLTSATAGIISALVVGMMMIHYAIRRNWLTRSDSSAQPLRSHRAGVIPTGERPSAGKLTVSSDVVETLSLHIVIIGVSIGIGYLIKQLLVVVEGTVPFLHTYRILTGFPLFPLCMVGGLIVQLLEERFDKHHLIDGGLIRRIQNTSVDFLVVSAIATIEFRIIARGIVPLLMLVTVGILWNVLCLLLLAPKAFRDAWFERAIVEMGQSMGVTATGLLLLRVVDPDYSTPAASAFAGKQLVHVLFICWTSTAIPLLATAGPYPVLLISTLVVAFCFMAILYLSARVRAPRSKVQ